jgi:hypothetical protein
MYLVTIPGVELLGYSRTQTGNATVVQPGFNQEERFQ